MVHTYSGISLSHKKSKMMPFVATWLDFETVILSEICWTEKDKYHMTSLIFRI